MKKLIPILLLLLSQLVLAETISGKVIKVSDGDTVNILDANFVKYHVRLSGIDAPEKDQPFGKRAQQKLSELVFGKEVEFDTHKLDMRKRPVGKLMVGTCPTCEKTIDAGYEVLKAGLAWHYKQYMREQTPADRQLYSQSEIEARTQQIGLWADADPTPPWEWRRAKKLKHQQATRQ